MGSGEYQSSRCLRAACELLSDEAVEQIAQQALAVAGLRGAPNPVELARALGYRVVRCSSMPCRALYLVTDKTIFFADSSDPAEAARRVAAPVATLVLEAWGYDPRAAERLTLALAG